MTVFWILLFIGIVSGVYHGFFNNKIYHDSGAYKNKHERVHIVWIHFVSGLAGSFCLYILYLKFLATQNNSLNFGVGDIAVLLIGLLGIVGLIPMTLWFMVLSINKFQDTFLDYIKKLIK